MLFYLKISCKDKRILTKFVNFFAKIKSLPIFIKSFPKNKKRKFITILKSPHVNKTAQEQFEFRFFSKDFLIFCFKPSIIFVILKKLQSLSFSGIKLEIKGLLKKNKNYRYVLTLINPDNIMLKQSHCSRKKFKKDHSILKPTTNRGLSKKYIQLFDFYGEVCLRNITYLQNVESTARL